MGSEKLRFDMVFDDACFASVRLFEVQRLSHVHVQGNLIRRRYVDAVSPSDLLAAGLADERWQRRGPCQAGSCSWQAGCLTNLWVCQ